MIEMLHHLKKTYLLIVLSLFSNLGYSQSCGPLALDSITDPGVYGVASLTESDGIRNGPDYSGATIYYPTNATPPFVGMAIVPGYASAQSTIQNWGPFLASHGIVTMTIGTNSIFENPYSRRDALLDAIVTLLEENTRTGSPLLGNLDTTRIAVGGWSMGGGGAQLAAAADTTLKAVMALTPWLDTSQLTPSDLNHPVPLLIFSGEIDGIAPPSSHADVHYSYTPQTTHKLIYEINNAGHSVANGPTGGQDYVGKIAVSWLKQYLIGDTCYCPLLLDTPSTASKYLTNVECASVATSVQDDGIDGQSLVRLYPNPGSGNIHVEVSILDDRVDYEIFSLTAGKVSRGVLTGRVTRIDIRDLTPGVYVLQVKSSAFLERVKFVVI
jgi:dienelactone hydrolase